MRADHYPKPFSVFFRTTAAMCFVHLCLTLIHHRVQGNWKKFLTFIKITVIQFIIDPKIIKFPFDQRITTLINLNLL